MTARNWRNSFRNVENDFWICDCISKSKKGLTFGELLEATGLSRSVLTSHLKSMSARILTTEGIGRERRYTVSPAFKEVLARHSGEEMVLAFMRMMLSHVPDKTLRNLERRRKVAAEFANFGRSRS